MLIECSECKQEVSDQAESCPHCGNPIRPPAADSEITRVARKERSAPIFLVLAVIAFLLSLDTPRFLLFFPIMGTLGCAAISLFRKEKGRFGAVLVFVFGIGLFLLNEMSTGVATGIKSPNLAAAEIVDWNWQKDPTFAGRGTIKWNVQVRNKSSQYIGQVKIEFTTFDERNRLIASTFTFLDAIPPGEIRSTSSFADLYGTEKQATVQITDVQLSN